MNDQERLNRERKLLKKLYECHDEMEYLLDKGKEDFHYLLIEMLIDRLEKHLEKQHDLL